MKKIRICQLITELVPGGAERIVYDLAHRLTTSKTGGVRFDVEVAALRGGAVADWLGREGIPTTVLGVRGKTDLAKLARLAGFFRRGRFDLVHTHLFHADLAGRLAGWVSNVPHLVHTVHAMEHRFRPWQFAFARLLSERCDRIVCVSQGVRDHHAAKSGLPLSRYVVIPNGVDVDAFARDESQRQKLRRQWGVREGEILLGFVGRLHVDKGADVLLEAMAILGGRGSGVRLVMAGQGPQQKIIEDQIRGEGLASVRLLGFRSDVPAILSAADVFAMPSRREGLPLAAAEAMAASLPVVGTDVVGLAEIIRHGQTGLVVPSEDPRALADAIERLADDPGLRGQMGLAALTRVREFFTIEKMLTAHERLYVEVTADRTSEKL